MARVAARISAITLAFSSGVRVPYDIPIVDVIAGGNWGSDCAVTLLCGKLFHLKEWVESTGTNLVDDEQ